MYAIEIASPGEAAALEYVDVPAPQPGPDQVLVEVAAAGVNFYDTYVRSGVYPATFPLRPGAEGAGRVTAVGAEVTEVSVGDEVAWASAVTGSYAQQVLLQADQALPVPEGMDLLTAAAIPLQGMTAQMLIDGVHTLGPADTVFITAGAGGVGQLFIQLAHSRGARVLTMVGTTAKAELAREAGADEVFVSADAGDLVTDLTTWIGAHTEGTGVDVFYDGLGKATFEAAVAAVRPRGMIVLFGGASGQVPPFDLQRLNKAGSLFVTRPTLWHYIASAAERYHRWEQVSHSVAAGQVRVHIGRKFDLADAGRAHEALESRDTTGKVLLVPAPAH